MLTREELFQEFADECAQLLNALETAGLLSLSRSGFETQVAETDRVLHTIKGGAATLRLPELTRASARLLELLRSRARDGADSWRQAGGDELLEEFVAAVRRFLRTSLEDPSAIEDGDKRQFAPLAERLERMCPRPAAPPESPTSRAPSPSKSQAADRNPPGSKEEIQRILASAPAREPRIEEIAELARRELERPSREPSEEPDETGPGSVERFVGVVRSAYKDATELPGREDAEALRVEEQTESPAEIALGPGDRHTAPSAGRRAHGVAHAPATGSGAGDDGSLDAQASERRPKTRKAQLPFDAAGYGFEALCARDAILRLLRGGRLDRSAEAALERVADILLALGEPCLLAEEVDLRTALFSGPQAHEGLRTLLAREDAISAAHPDLRMAPQLGRLIGDLLCSLLRPFDCTPRTRSEPLTLEVDRTEDDGWVVTIRGLRPDRSACGRTKMSLGRHRVAALGGRVRHEKEGNELTLLLPAAFHVTDVLRALSEGSEFGLLGHRVVAVLELEEDAGRSSRREHLSPDGSRTMEFEGSAIELISLVGAPSENDQAGPTKTAVVLNGGRNLLAVHVDKVLGRGRQLVQVSHAPDAQSEILGYCIDAAGAPGIPLLSPAILQK